METARQKIARIQIEDQIERIEEKIAEKHIEIDRIKGEMEEEELMVESANEYYESNLLELDRKLDELMRDASRLESTADHFRAKIRAKEHFMSQRVVGPYPMRTL